MGCLRPTSRAACRQNRYPSPCDDEKNVDNFRRQIQSIGLSYDWDREIDTTDQKYYKWTQWIFLQLYKKGLAYQSNQPVNWCEELGTVLANEEVIDGKSEVGGFPVVKKPMRQWVLKITEYAERLLTDLDDLDWPEPLKEMQRNWIGKSEGAEVEFAIADKGEKFTVFTTRPDTLFGATFVVLAPEHQLVKKITSDEQKELVAQYIKKTEGISDRDRISTTEKTGVFTGAYALNPVNGEKLPVYIADYVLVSYGHGAIMAVPGHDERDHEFAKKFGIEIKRVVEGGDNDINEAAYSGDGKLVNSDFLNGLDKAKAISKMNEWLEDKSLGKKHDYLQTERLVIFSSKVLGRTFPIVLDKDGKDVAVDESELPIILPEMEEFKPTGDGDPPLARATEWLKYEKDGIEYVRETNTMPQWAGSCWYYLRYIDPDNADAPWDKKKEEYWMPVDLYVGGVEHAVLHLLYARFWHKVLYDLGHVSTKEPFQKLVNQGMILGENGEKMSKSRGNVVNPDEVIEKWGADAFRVYEMFMGPLEQVKPWNTDGLNGTNRFVKRAWRLLVDEKGEARQTGGEISKDFERVLHKTIKKVTEDTETLRFNTAIAAMMEFLNAASKETSIGKDAALAFTKLLSPYAPHVAEEVWEKYGFKNTISYESWPTYDEDLCKETTINLPVQVNGKLRGTVEIDKSASKDEVLKLAKELEGVIKYTDGKTIFKEIYVPGKIINLVVK